MKLKLSILVFVFGTVISGNGQIKFELVSEFSTSTKDFTTDHLNKIYLIDNNQIFKLNYAGDTLYTYSNKTLGNISCLDVNNTLRPILFFKENARIVVTDNTLSAQQNSYSLEDLDLYQAQLIASSLVDNGIWIYDQELFQLIKVNKGFERIYESGNLEQILQKDGLNPSQILEHMDNVYMVCPRQGVLVFDIYGSYIKTVPVLNVDEIQVENSVMYYQKEGNYYGYGLIDFEEVKIQLPFDSFEKIRLEKDRLIVLSKNKIAIYSIGNN
jgi:hypothetical protein